MFKKKQDHTLKIVLGIVGLGVTVVGTIAGGVLWKKKKENSYINSNDFETCDLSEEAVDIQMKEAYEEIDEPQVDESMKINNILTEEELKFLSEL